MKRTEAIEKIKALGPKDAVHCPTEKEAVEFCNLMNEAGLKWCSNSTYLGDTEWSSYKETTCYIPKKGEFCDMPFYLDHKYIIHKASDFLGGEEEEKKTEFVLEIDLADTSLYDMEVLMNSIFMDTLGKQAVCNVMESPYSDKEKHIMMLGLIMAHRCRRFKIEPIDLFSTD